MAVVISVVPSPGSSTNMSDALAPTGSGNIGADIGQVANGGYTPLVGNQSANQGSKDLYLRHNSVDDPITDVEFYLAPYTGVYGGPKSPAIDYAEVISAGFSDGGGTPNNTDGLSSGLHIDMSYSVTTGSQFAPARESTGQVRVFGKIYNSNQVGIQTNPIGLHKDACFYYDGVSNSAPINALDGVIGKEGDTVRGNRAHLRLRYYLPLSASVNGLIQWSFVTLFSYTS